MAPHNRKLKLITFTLGGTSFECQVDRWQVVNNTEDGQKFYTYCPDGEFREDGEDDYALELRFFADWRSAGINDYLTLNDKQTVTAVLDHHPDIVGEHVRWTGSVKIKAPSAGGDVRTTEQTEVTLPYLGKPTYARI